VEVRTTLWIGLGIVVAMAVVVAGLTAGWALWGTHLWASGPFDMPKVAASTGPGRAYDGWSWSQGDAPTHRLTIEDAREAAERYAASLDYPHLDVAEVMEFDRNFYAIVQESDTGVGAMELLVDKWTGSVRPEMGPNMMWNGRYGMHKRGGGKTGSVRETNVLLPDEVERIAQRWLDTYRQGVKAEEHADRFYGYYTLHTVREGQIEGMLSVHGTTGQVWYHTWHGPFIQMIEREEGAH
jgi:hypothetical protein